jgi:hypothetical protein
MPFTAARMVATDPMLKPLSAGAPSTEISAAHAVPKIESNTDINVNQLRVRESMD